MQSVPPRVILFDFGGVLAEEGFRDCLLALAHEQGLDAAAMPAEGTRAVYDSGFVVGRGTAASFWQLLRARTGLRGDDDTLTTRILDGFIVRDWLIALVRQLHVQGVVTGILSDQTLWLDQLDARYHFSSAFDHIFNSYYLGKGKRDPGLFDEVVDRLGVMPDEVLFIDDDAGNVARAQAAGLQAIRYTDRQAIVTTLQAYIK